MDVFIEQLVIRKSDGRDIALKICVIMGMVAFSSFCLTMSFVFWALPFVSLVAMVAIPGVIWLGVHFFKGLTLEYEYILTNRDFDIDKIMGRRKRRRMVTLNLMNAEKFDMVGKDSSFDADVTVSAHDNTYNNMWYLIVKHDSYGRVVLLFNPGDEFIVKLNKALLPRVRNKKVCELSD